MGLWTLWRIGLFCGLGSCFSRGPRRIAKRGPAHVAAFSLSARNRRAVYVVADDDDVRRAVPEIASINVEHT